MLLHSCKHKHVKVRPCFRIDLLWQQNAEQLVHYWRPQGLRVQVASWHQGDPYLEVLGCVHDLGKYDLHRSWLLADSANWGEYAPVI